MNLQKELDESRERTLQARVWAQDGDLRIMRIALAEVEKVFVALDRGAMPPVSFRAILGTVRNALKGNPPGPPEPPRPPAQRFG